MAQTQRDFFEPWAETIVGYPKIDSKIIKSRFCNAFIDPSLQINDREEAYKYHALKQNLDK